MQLHGSKAISPAEVLVPDQYFPSGDRSFDLYYDQRIMPSRLSKNFRSRQSNCNYTLGNPGTYVGLDTIPLFRTMQAGAEYVC